MKKQRGQNVTDKILDTAERLFYQQGYNATGINQVIEEADIAKASLYKHFESKTDLLTAYIDRFYNNWFELLEQRINQANDPEEKLLAIFDHLSERQLFRNYGGCPFIKINSEAGYNNPYVISSTQKQKQKFRGFIALLVSECRYKKLFSDEELTEMVFLMAEGGVAAASVHKQSQDLQAAKQLIQKLLY